MVPTCGASRASLMTGLRPHSTRFVSYTSRADEDASGITTLNQHFRNNDYITISLGKVFHAADDSIAGWSEKPWRPKTRDHHDQAAERRDIAQHKAKYPRRTKVRGKPYEVFEAADSTYRDHEVATRAIEQLKQFQNRDAPFFLAVGFYKPHLPFCAPKKYWDLYDFDSIQIPDNYRIPPNAPRLAVHQSSELRSYATIPPTGQVSTYQARKLIHGYYACVSFIDAQVGRLMAALEVTGLSKNTIVVLCGDHGWQLGEHGMWNKHSCFETSMHTPLIVYAPDTSATSTPTPGASKQGGRISALTEFIDIYPSLCELAEIDPPNHLQGSSFVPLLQDPTRPGKPQAVGRYRAGDTIRTNQYRFSEYHGLRSSELVAGRMLYDHNADADENNNLAGEKKHESTVKRLSSQLRAITPEVQP